MCFVYYIKRDNILNFALYKTTKLLKKTCLFEIFANFELSVKH